MNSRALYTYTSPGAAHRLHPLLWNLNSSHGYSKYPRNQKFSVKFIKDLVPLRVKFYAMQKKSLNALEKI